MDRMNRRGPVKKLAGIARELLVLTPAPATRHRITVTVEQLLKVAAEKLLPDTTLRRLRIWKHRRYRTRYVERIVRHHYGGDEFQVIIS